MTIPQAAIEAVAEAIDALDWWALPPSSTEIAATALEAALPHIREHIAQEIEARAEDFFEEMGYEAKTAPGMLRAARIVRGEP